MNTQKKVFEKLFSNEKVELASQKFEFAIYDDVKALLKMATDANSKAKALDDKAFKLLSDLNATISASNSLVGSSSNLFKSSAAIMAKLKENAKMFGFDATSTDAFKLNNDLLKSIDSLNSYAGLGKAIASKVISN
jgi:hypothetical protein